MGRRTAATSIRVQSPDGAHVVLAPGDEVPAWAVEQVTNEDAFVDDSAAEEDSPIPVVAAPATGDYESLTVADLRGLIKTSNEGRDDDTKIATDGNKADLIAALAADDRAV